MIAKDGESFAVKTYKVDFREADFPKIRGEIGQMSWSETFKWMLSQESWDAQKRHHKSAIASDPPAEEKERELVKPEAMQEILWCSQTLKGQEQKWEGRALNQRQIEISGGEL